MGHLKIEYDRETPSSNVVIVAVLLSCVFIGLVTFLSYYLYISLVSIDQDKKQTESGRNVYILDLEKSYQQSLSTLKWKDQDNNVVQIPIDMAIDHVIKDYSQR